MIITGYIALLGFIYDSISFDELGVAAFLAMGLVGWLLSSSMCVYAYWGSRRQTEKQADYYFNKSRPKKARISLSEFFVRHRSRQSILTIYPPLALFFSFISIPFLVLSLVEELAIGAFLVVIMTPVLAILLGLIIGGITIFWDERRAIKHEIQKEDSLSIKTNIMATLIDSPLLDNKREIGENQRMFVVSKEASEYKTELIDDFQLYIYPYYISKNKGLCGIIEGASDSAHDRIYTMAHKERIDIFISCDGKLVEFRNCRIQWKDFGQLIWECEYSVNFNSS